MILTRPRTNCLIAALIALALAVLGFGHRQAGAAPLDPMLSAYLQTGGTLADLCIDDEGGPKGMAQDCPVCTLSQMMALAPDLSGPGVALRLALRDLPLAGHLLTTRHAPRAPPARGPPAFPV